MTELGDFTATRRIVPIAGVAIAIGVLAAFVALALLSLIGLFTNLCFFQRWDTQVVVPANHHLGLFVVLVPIAGEERHHDARRRRRAAATDRHARARRCACRTTAAPRRRDPARSDQSAAAVGAAPAVGPADRAARPSVAQIAYEGTLRQRPARPS